MIIHTHTHTHLPDQLTGGGELAGIQLVEDERAWLARARREVESQGKKMLLQGLELMVGERCSWYGG